MRSFWLRFGSSCFAAGVYAAIIGFTKLSYVLDRVHLEVFNRAVVSHLFFSGMILLVSLPSTRELFKKGVRRSFCVAVLSGFLLVILPLYVIALSEAGPEIGDDVIVLAEAFSR